MPKNKIGGKKHKGKNYVKVFKNLIPESNETIGQVIILKVMVDLI